MIKLLAQLTIRNLKIMGLTAKLRILNALIRKKNK